tara:strand:+ start:247 stop:1200 length:954 start_codon:yes stop_codon:yes gene_type:complete
MISINDFTIIIPCIRYQDVKNCIKQIRKKYKKIKIIVCLNKINLKQKRKKNIKFILTKTDSIAEKRNISVNNCKTKYMAFLDSDAYPDEGWIESSFRFLKKKKNFILAGPHVDPLKQNESQKLIGLIKKSFLITMKPKLQKSNSEKVQYVSFMPSVNWILSKKFYNSLKQMNGKILRNEDWDFVYKMKKKNFKVLYSPKTLVFHENANILQFIKKRFIYGFHMWPILKKLNFENYYFFLPLIFSFFLLSFPLGFIFKYYFFLYFSILGIYFLFVLFETIRLCNKLNNFLKMLFILIFANISPGFGILLGLFQLKKNK